MASEECLNSRLAQMNVNFLGCFLGEVFKDRIAGRRPSAALFEAHLQSMEGFYSELPIYFQARPQMLTTACRMFEGVNDRQKTSIVCLSLRLINTSS